MLPSYDNPIEVSHRPWQRRIEIYSPKLRRRVTLFSSGFDLMPDMNSTRVIDSSPRKRSFASLVCANLPTSDSIVV